MSTCYDDGNVRWYDFEPEPEMTGDGAGDPDTHYLTIALVDPVDGSKGEEVAVICHRTCEGRYPIDGELANSKRRNAQIIVDALNHNHHGRTFAELFDPTAPDWREED